MTDVHLYGQVAAARCPAGPDPDWGCVVSGDAQVQLRARKELWLDVQDAQRKVADTADKLRQARQQHRDITAQVAAREAPLRRAHSSDAVRCMQMQEAHALLVTACAPAGVHTSVFVCMLDLAGTGMAVPPVSF